MKTTQILALATSCMLSLTATAASRSSANYSVPADTTDCGGQRVTSAAYTIDGSVGGIGGIGTVVAPATTAKHSYIGQLYEVQSLALTANPTNVNEGATCQLGAVASLDDGSQLVPAPSSVGWSVVNGPLTSINAAGLATAGGVYENTLATARGNYFSRSATFGLLVLNVNNDNFGTYAGDGLDDAWQVQYFGLNNPQAAPGLDPDLDGQTNGYEYVVGTIPIDALSKFRMRIKNVLAQPTHRNLIFSPRYPTRTYSPEYRLDAASGPFISLSSVSTSDAGIERTVTDLQATNEHRFYRIQVSFP